MSEPMTDRERVIKILGGRLTANDDRLINAVVAELARVRREIWDKAIRLAEENEGSDLVAILQREAARDAEEQSS